MDDRLVAYMYYFNVKRDYFECHEVGESLWLDTGRPIVLKGLIQAAVCLYHFENGNVKGAVSMWLRAREYLSPYVPVYEGIDLIQLIADIDTYFGRVPSAWYDKQVTLNEIDSLQLSPISLMVIDPRLKQAVLSFREVR